MKLVKDTNRLKEKNQEISDQKAEEAIKTIIQWIGEDPDREGLKSTPKRVIRAFKEYFQGYKEDPTIYLRKTFTEVEGYDDMVIEKNISLLGKKAKDGKITIDDLQGGTFTITNGGIYGSMLSTPILNPPQSAVLGMHNIIQRPVVVDGNIIVRPMMYLALSYDHRIIDGKEAVSFLKIVKESLEQPKRLFLNL